MPSRRVASQRKRAGRAAEQQKRIYVYDTEHQEHETQGIIMPYREYGRFPLTKNRGRCLESNDKIFILE